MLQYIDNPREDPLGISHQTVHTVYGVFDNQL